MINILDNPHDLNALKDYLHLNKMINNSYNPLDKDNQHIVTELTSNFDIFKVFAYRNILDRD